MHIGERIRVKREELGMTQEELANKMGYKSKATINKIELGINDVTQSKVVEYAKVLNTTIPYLMGWADKESLQPSNAEKLARLSMYDEKILVYADKLAKLPKEQQQVIFNLIDTLKKPQDSE